MSYRRFASADLTLRDLLAVDRTVLANERTLLGYVRTTLAFLAAGFTLLHLFESGPAVAGGWVLVGASAPLFGIGLWHYVAQRAALAPVRHHGDTAPPEDRAAG